ncbi:glycosyltransferase family 31 protein [Xylariomycetidae sp. FL2044]|nr:glycosyltransferase family 31 protein [Xylariomycetidae sp. FL2044]
MIISPSSRRVRILGGVTVLTSVAVYIHLRPQWRQTPLEVARDYYASVANYISGPVYNNTLYTPGNEEYVHRYYNSSSPCDNFPDTTGIQLVMKTGATEAYDRIPTHLLTTLSCLPDYLIFSDMEQQIGSAHIYDALAEVEESAKAHNTDFDLYREQKECPVSQKSCVDAKADRDKAWNLDKYKFLPMMEQTWRMRPGRDWYIFAEADTYVFWGNVVQWLRKESKLNPREKIFLGSRSYINATPFAHGGSGYILSGTLLKHLIEYHPGVVKQYNVRGANECCGDLMLALALDEYENVKMRQTWPMINGEKPSTLPYAQNHWCEPILTMHHMNAEEVSNVWQFEQTRKTDRTIMIRDLYEALIKPKMQVSRNDWDNLSDDVCYMSLDPNKQASAEGLARDRQKPEDEMNDIEKEAWKSAENCAKVCDSIEGNLDDESENDKEKKNRSCFQWRWQDEICCTSRSFKLGAPKPSPDNKQDKSRWMSGWHLKGINDWIEAMGDCKEPAWKTPEL